MEKVDRLGWAAGLSFTAYGLRIGIRANDPDVLERVKDLLPPGCKPSGSPKVEHLYSLLVGGTAQGSNVRRFNLLYAGPARLARTMDLDEALITLQTDLKLYTAEWARRRLFVHAGVVGWRGRAIVIPGRTFTGKTTLVAALVRAGATYYSDEYAVFDARGRVHPYSRPLLVRENPDEPGKKCPVEMLGGVAGVKPLPIGRIVVTKYRSGARWRPRLLSLGQGVMALLANTVAARSRPEVALDTLREAVCSADLHQGVRGEAEEMAVSLLKS